MKIIFLAIVSVCVLGLSSLTFAGDVAAGKALADKKCASCHGAAGVSPNDLWPNLAGQKKGYLVKQITAFRDKKRNDPMMAAMVIGLTDDQIKNLAAFYAGLE